MKSPSPEVHSKPLPVLKLNNYGYGPIGLLVRLRTIVFIIGINYVDRKGFSVQDS